MPATWEDLVQPASWKGIEIEVISSRLEGSHDLDKRKVPGGAGADIDERGRNEYPIQMRVAFFGDAYPDRYFDFVHALEEGGAGELIHPVRGRITAFAERWSEVHDAEDAADYVAIDVTWVEHTTGGVGPFELRDAASVASLLRAAADDADVANAKLQAYVDGLGGAAPAPLASAPAAVTASTAALVSAGNALEADQDTLSLAEVTAHVDRVLAQIGAASTLVSTSATLEAHAVGLALATGAARLAELGRLVIENRPPLITVTVPAAMPLLTFAHLRYGDSSRASEILRLNSIPSPMWLVAGQELRIYAV